MLHSFDLFRMDAGDAPTWIGTVNDMESAKEVILDNAGKQRTRFLVWAQETETNTLYDATKYEIVLVNESAVQS
jgi:hypothetical protein